jgi:hypothetical protein
MPGPAFKYVIEPCIDPASGRRQFPPVAEVSRRARPSINQHVRDASRSHQRRRTAFAAFDKARAAAAVAKKATSRRGRLFVPQPTRRFVSRRVRPTEQPLCVA